MTVSRLFLSTVGQLSAKIDLPALFSNEISSLTKNLYVIGNYVPSSEQKWIIIDVGKETDRM